MSWLENIFAGKTIKTYKLIFDWNVKESEEILKTFEHGEDSVFELLMFTTTFILRTIKTGKPEAYSFFEKIYLAELISFSNEHRMSQKISIGLTDFIDERMVLYQTELDRIADSINVNYSANRLYYYFVEKPLNLVSGQSADVSASFLLEIKIKALLLKINQLIIAPLLTK